MVARGRRGAEGFEQAFQHLAPDADVRVVNPYAGFLNADDFAGVDGVVFTGSGVSWSTDAREAACQRAAMELAFDAGLPSWGSCNGMQLAAVVLGGQVAASPNGLEVGVARETRLTPAGQSHPQFKSRTAVFAVPCIHRDEVSRLPTGAIKLAENNHSEHQAFSYDQGDVSFWGAQYHPELRTTHVAYYLEDGDSIFAGKSALIADLNNAETDAHAAARLGTVPDALTVSYRTIELANWLAHVKQHADRTRQQ